MHGRSVKDDYVVIERDVDARMDLVREVVERPEDPLCGCCGRRRRSGRLFRYGTRDFDKIIPDFPSSGDLFCSLKCWKKYNPSWWNQ